MTYEQFIQIYNEMIRTSNADATLTHIDVCFQIRKINIEPKRARINIKTFKDDKRETLGTIRKW
jgi:hypothetical protein